MAISDKDFKDESPGLLPYEKDLQSFFEQREAETLDEASRSFKIRKKWSRVAEEQSQRGNHLQAAFLFRKGGNKTANRENLLKAARAYRKAGVYPKAAFLLERCQRPVEAADLLEEWARCNRGRPNNRDFIQKAIQLRLRSGQVDAAVQTLLRWGAVKHAARLLTRQGRRREAAQLLEDRGHPLEAAGLLEKMRDVHRARRLQAAEALQRGETLKSARLYREGGDLVMAGQQYEAAGHHLEAGQCYAHNHQYQEAAECFLKINDFLTAAEMLVQAGHPGRAAEIFQSLGKHSLAVRYFHQAGQYFEGGAAARAAGNFRDALKNFQKVPRDHPRYLDAMLEVSRIFQKEKQDELLVPKLEKLLTRPLPLSYKLRFQYLLAQSCEETTHFQKALDLFRSILEEDLYYRDVPERVKSLRKTIEKYRKIQRQQTHANERYRIRFQIGEGGMGTVYQARDLYLNRIVAIKEMKAPFHQTPENYEMFLREARAVAALNHPNIVKIYDFGRINRTGFISMEFIDGEDVYSLIRRHGGRPLTPAQVIHLGIQVGIALAYAHEKGIVHRDIKPQNMMITRDLILKLMDFGIATVGREPSIRGKESIVGSPHYISPEQILDGTVDHRCDIYSLGITLYHCISGRVPFEEGDILSRHINELPAPPSHPSGSLPPGLREVIMRCLEKSPRNRYPDAHSLVRKLEEIRPLLPAENTGAEPVEGGGKTRILTEFNTVVPHSPGKKDNGDPSSTRAVSSGE